MPDLPKTSCKKCVFAMFAENGSQLQTSCALGRLEAFREQKVPLTIMPEGHCEIGRFCNACRDNDNFKTGESFADFTKRVQKEIEVRCDFIIYVDGDSTYAQLRESIRSALTQNGVLPRKIIVLLANNGLRPSSILKVFADEKKTSPRCKTVEVAVEQCLMVEDDPLVHLDLAVRRSSSTYYCFAIAGHKFTYHLLSTLNRAINERMMSVVMVLPDDTGNEVVIQTAAHIALQSMPGDIVTKIRHMSKEQECPHVIQTLQSLMTR